MPTRSAEEIRTSIERNRQEFGVSLDRLHGEVAKLTDWRTQVRRHGPKVAAGALAAGFVLGGGLGGVGRLLFGRR